MHTVDRTKGERRGRRHGGDKLVYLKKMEKSHE
jgi:hypothetical protein